MDIQAKIDRISALIGQLPEDKRCEGDSPLSKELSALSQDPSLPKVMRGFCFDLARHARGDATGPLNNVSKRKVREIFLALKVSER